MYSRPRKGGLKLAQLGGKTAELATAPRRAAAQPHCRQTNRQTDRRTDEQAKCRRQGGWQQAEWLRVVMGELS